MSVVEYEVRGGEAWITLNRPKRGNAITPEMGMEIRNYIEKSEQNPSVRIIVITGNGKYFCTGMDLGSSNQGSLKEDLISGVAAERSILLFKAIKNCKKPTIALVNGPIFGGGCGVFFCCDIRVCVDHTFLCFSEVKRGIVPALISSFIVPQLGESLSLLYMTTGMKLPIQQLQSLGLSYKLVRDVSEGEGIITKIAEEVSQCGPGAVANTKKVVQYVSGHKAKENEEKVKQVFSETVQSQEAIYGVSCFASKKKPDWTSFSSKL